jgi:hypothetical protein
MEKDTLEEELTACIRVLKEADNTLCKQTNSLPFTETEYLLLFSQESVVKNLS